MFELTNAVLSASRRHVRVEEPERLWNVEDLTVLAPGSSPWCTVIVPTRNEMHGVAALLERLATSLHGIVAEILFVDDSSDDTPHVIREQARTSGLAVRLLHRQPGEQQGGLSGAVVAGLKAARGAWAVVMDADLQHPPEMASRLVAVGQSRQLDLVVGTRYSGAGNAQGLAGRRRRVVSSASTRVTKALFPRRLWPISDPMSGFFAVRLAALDLGQLNPIGFKILLELAVRQPELQVAEMPFVFGTRIADLSKANAREGMRFIAHLLRLRMAVMRHQMARSSAARPSQRMRRLVMFGLVGAVGVVVNEAALWALSSALGAHFLVAAVLATEASTTSNFALTELLVFRGPKPGTLLGRGLRFYLMNHAALALRLPLLAALVEVFGTNLLVGNLITLVVLFAFRFVIADSAIYGAVIEEAEKQPMRITVDMSRDLPTFTNDSDIAAASEATKSAAARPGSRYLPYRYSIDGVLTVGSQVPLLELEYFRAQWVGSDVDLSIRIGNVGRGTPRARAMMTQYSSPPGLSYEEHFGRLGANFTVNVGNTIEVVCSQTLARSPHVLYTNVIEALLRFITVSRGRVLLHSACLELNGSGLLLSARTDTGKTGSVLRLLREYGAQFLSDDMTILDPSGLATCFPKPLTISHHTLRAVEAGDLTAAEWRRLKLQSRLHSKEGRQFGMMLAGMNIPIMAINSLTQRVVPPPKYNVDRLVECQIIRNTHVENLFVIERGEPQLRDVGFEETIQTLLENTDDAYGFPPFRQMAPSIVIGNDDYAELRRRERLLLIQAMSAIRVRRLASNTFSWADDIASVLGTRTSESAAPAMSRVASASS